MKKFLILIKFINIKMIFKKIANLKIINSIYFFATNFVDNSMF